MLLAEDLIELQAKVKFDLSRTLRMKVHVTDWLFWRLLHASVPTTYLGEKVFWIAGT